MRLASVVAALTAGSQLLSAQSSNPPVVLRRITSTAASACRTKNLEDLATWQLWEDTRTALIAAAAFYAEHRNEFRIAEVRRVFETRSGKLRTIAFEEASFTAAQPWTSMAPDDLALHGYVTFGDDRLSFISPDIEVLLSKSFENTHCFQPTFAQRDGMVGLTFEPGRTLKNNTDVAGTFWLDAQSHELRQLDFHHTGLPSFDIDSAGESEVRFTTFGAHEWFISEWQIRAPVPQLYVARGLPQIEQFRLFGDVITGRDSRQFRWRLGAVTEQRGAVLGVYRDSGGADRTAVWTAPTGKITVTVSTKPIGREPTLPVEGAQVSLIGSKRQLITDAVGSVTFDQLTSGEYLISVNTMASRLLGEPPSASAATVSAGAVAAVAVDVRMPREIIRGMCGTKPSDLTGGRVDPRAVVGTVFRDGLPVRGARFAVLKESALTGDRGNPIDGVSKLRSDADGRFIICAGPSDPAGKFQLLVRVEDDPEIVKRVTFAPGSIMEVADVILPSARNP
jgi:hypothetical protein